MKSITQFRLNILIHQQVLKMPAPTSELSVPNYCVDIKEAMAVLKACHARAADMNDGDNSEYLVRINLDTSGDSSIYLLERRLMESTRVWMFNGVDELPDAICEFACLLFRVKK